MSIGYDVSANLPWLRDQAESRFTETFEFYTTAETTDPVTLALTVVETPIASDVAGRVKFTETLGRDVESGGQFPVIARREIHVAVGSVDVSTGVRVRCTASTADLGLVGRVFRIADGSTAGQVTAWRYPVEELT